MANTTISGLSTAATTLNDADLFETEQGGSSKKVAASVIADYLAGGGLSDGVKLGGTAAANLLDDYEEGTWTPVFFGSSTAGVGTYSPQSGYYTKIGNTVFWYLNITISAHTGSGNVRFTLPFVSSSRSASGGGGSGYTSNITYPAGCTTFGYQPISSSANAGLFGSGSATAVTAITDFVGSFVMSGFYEV